MTIWVAMVDFFGTLILGVTALCVVAPLLRAPGWQPVEPEKE